jgi:methylmalonyl-CoA mutase N-terminal domain/subunit
MIESLTDQIEATAKDYIEKIDARGGALAAINNGFMQREIQEAAYQVQLAIERGDEVVVGVNDFTVDEEIELESLSVDPSVEEDQKTRLAALRARRDNGKVSSLLGQLEEAAKGDTPLMPLMIECAENDITLGEICGVLRQVWGQYRPPTFI